MIPLFTVNPGNKRLFKGQFLFGCAKNDLDEKLIRQICLVDESRRFRF